MKMMRADSVAVERVWKIAMRVLRHRRFVTRFFQLLRRIGNKLARAKC
jgi:hypothetical protein